MSSIGLQICKTGFEIKEFYKRKHCFVWQDPLGRVLSIKPDDKPGQLRLTVFKPDVKYQCLSTV